MYMGKISHRTSLLILSILLIASTQAAAQAGKLDPTFGKGGIVTTDFGTQSGADPAGVAIQPDGKIVVFGGVRNIGVSEDLRVVRYNTNGSLDAGFGNAGIVIVPDLTFAAAMTLQPDGKIVAVGFNAGHHSGPAGIAVLRLSTNGTLDSTFGTAGVATTGILVFGAAGAVVVQPDGKILLADGDLIRLLPNGQLDSSFGTGGQAHVIGGGSVNDSVNAMTLLHNGKILVSSASLFPTSGSVSRYHSNGSLDTSFAINGQLGTTGPANTLLLLGSGEFLAGGNLNIKVNGPVGFAVSRYQAVGVIDAKFGTHGGVATPLPNFSTTVTSGLGVQSSGDIVTLATALVPHTPQVFALARYTATGQLDHTFGKNGTVTTSFGTTTVAANGLAIQSDDKIVTFGCFATSQSDAGFKLARYLTH
jgi:uncharacterized delta-60 repeat protein